jgi:Transglutaminase-like superfamily
MDCRDWCSLSDEQLAGQDIAEVNLSCAVGLPGAEELNVSACLRTLEQWTDRVRLGISNAMRNRARIPEYFDLSDAEYRILTIFAVLYRHLGLTVNLDCLVPDYVHDAGDARKHFLHAVLLDEYPATCCTAAILFAAIGRRLGYPIRLVKSREHLFCRWVGSDGERFNLEATNQGYYRTSDEYYLDWPKPIYREALRCGIFHTDLTPRQELGLFLHLRGICLRWNFRPEEAVELSHYATQSDPRDYFIRNEWIMATMFWHAEKSAKNWWEASNPGPTYWRIPTWCREWSVSLYQLACEQLDFIRSQRELKDVELRACSAIDSRYL